MNRAHPLLRKLVDVRPNEVGALLLAGLFNFVILGSYYVIRPIRDDIAAAGGVENLSWMFTGTLVVTLLANAAFAAIVAPHAAAEVSPDRLPVLHREPDHFLSAHAAHPAGAAERLDRACVFRLGECF